MACAMTNPGIMNRKHLDESFPAVSLSDFRDIPFILLSDGNSLNERARVMFEKENMTPQVIMRLSQPATARHLSCEGLGTAFISDHLTGKGSDSVFFSGWILAYRKNLRFCHFGKPLHFQSSARLHKGVHIVLSSVNKHDH